MDRSDLEVFAEYRSRIYYLLSSFYLRKPDKLFLEELKSNISKIRGGIDEELRKSLDTLKNTLERSDIEKLSHRLVIEFTKLFRGVKKGYGPPPPYESVYRGEGRVVGEVTLEVMKMYRDAGFGIIDEYAGPQDYIGAELKFMSFLCHKEMEAWLNNNLDEGKNCLEIEKKFLEKHLLIWVSDFCMKIKRGAREKYYVSVVELTERFTKMDGKNIEILLKGFKL